jgi:hypothetical protein
MVRALALVLILLACGGAVRAESITDLLADRGLLICLPDSVPGSCGAPEQLAAANCGQTCYDDQNACHQGCDKAYSGAAPGHDRCIAACSTTYGRCQTRCNAPQRSPRPSQ